MEPATRNRPDWNRLYEIAAGQEGLFTTQQAAEAGYSPQLLVHYVNSGRAVRMRRGIYRLVHFPAGEHEDLVAAWLWSERAGVVSHQTALALHDSLTFCLRSFTSHFRPPGCSVASECPTASCCTTQTFQPDDRTWFGAVPTTSVRRTLNDCAIAGLAPDLLRQGAEQALRRGIVKLSDLGPVQAALAPFGGLAA